MPIGSPDENAAATLANELCDVVSVMRQKKPRWYGKVKLEAHVVEGRIDLGRATAAEIEETAKLGNGR